MTLLLTLNVRDPVQGVEIKLVHTFCHVGRVKPQCGCAAAVAAPPVQLVLLRSPAQVCTQLSAAIQLEIPLTQVQNEKVSETYKDHFS